MSYLVYCTIGILSVYGQFVFSNPTTYDQRQSGDVNVQIHLKDVQVVALLDPDLLDDYTDYDYAYDYADFTVKPGTKPTTITPIVSDTTFETLSTWPIESSNISTKNQQESTTASIKDENISQITKTNETTSVKLRINDKDGDKLLADQVNVKIDDEKKIVAATTSDETNLKKKSCPARYVLDKKGHCRSITKRRRISLVPLTMRLGSRLSEKGHFNVRKDLPIRVYKSGQKL